MPPDVAGKFGHELALEGGAGLGVGGAGFDDGEVAAGERGVDVEGAEDLILEPFLRDAPRELWPKLLLMEFSHGKWATDLPRLLSACGYREALRTRQNVAYVLEEKS